MAISLLKVGDVNLNGWPESDFRLGEKLSRKDFAIEVLSDVRRPSVVESLAMTPTSQGRVKMIEQSHLYNLQARVTVHSSKRQVVIVLVRRGRYRRDSRDAQFILTYARAW